MVEKAILKFVALGDSLTYGYQTRSIFQPGGRALPYTEFLKAMLPYELQDRKMGHVEIVFENAGVPGDTVRGMLARLDAHVASLEPDYVIVWGGINDLFSLRKPGEVLDDLGQIYGKSRAAGAEPIACTVTPVLGYDRMVPLITELNDMIKGHCERQGVPLIDLFEATSDGWGRLRENFSEDGVHLTGSGYRRVAEAVGEVVLELMSERLRAASDGA